MRRLIALTILGFALALPAGAAATFPDNNGRIAFSAGTSAGRQLFTMRSNGQNLVQVTNLDGDATKLDWSPDGHQLAFTLNDCSVAFVDADGTNLRVLPPENPERTPGVDVCDGDPSFTPDGREVVYDHYDALLDKEDIRIMRLDGTQRLVVTDAGGPDPNVSPDGSKIAFKGADPSSSDCCPLLVANLDGTGLMRVSQLVDVTSKSDWAPDGSRLAFSDYADPTPEQPVNIWTVRPDGTGLTQLTHYADPRLNAQVGSYSPDGQWIVFRLNRVDLGLRALYRIRPDGNDMHQVTDWSTFLPASNDWGPKPAR